MPYPLKQLENNPIHALTPHELRRATDRLINIDRPRYRRLWAYYRNPMQVWATSVMPTPGKADISSDRPYRQAQEWGLPSRITGVRAGTDVLVGQVINGVARKEVVIENDIGWRIDTTVNYLYGKPLVINSTAPDESRRAILSDLMRAILAHNGGILFLQQLALISALYGFVDVLVKIDPPSQADEEASASDLSAAITGLQELGQTPPAPAPMRLRPQPRTMNLSIYAKPTPPTVPLI